MKKQNFTKTCLKISFLTLVVSLSLQVAITNRFAIKGEEMLALEDTKVTLEKEISVLRLEIAEISSFNSIENKALALGFEAYNDNIKTIEPASFAAVSEF